MSMDSFFVEALNVVGQMGISLGVTGRKDLLCVKPDLLVAPLLIY